VSGKRLGELAQRALSGARRLGAGALLLPAIALALGLGLAACGSSKPELPRFAVLVMENREYGQVIGNPGAPYINSLAQHYALAERYYGVSHPSLPNYLALIGGATFGIRSDCTRCHVTGPNLVDQLETAGISWRAYMEGIPSPCYRSESEPGRYAKRHNPFAYFDSVIKSPDRCFKVVPLNYLRDDLREDTLPRFVWITPDVCNDAHDCSLAVGDRFLSRLVPPLLAKLGPKGVLFLTWDEGTTSRGCCEKAKGGRIVTIAAGQGARAGIRSRVRYDHYSLLRTIEEEWGLPRLRNAGCSCTTAMTDLLSLGKE
jgi:hypothetical protein